jgi:hypothetical protein
MGNIYTLTIIKTVRRIGGRQKWKEILAFVDWNNIVKMFTMPKVIYRFHAIPAKILVTFPQKLENNPKIYTEPIKSQNPYSNCEKKNKARGVTLPGLNYLTKLH